MGEGNTAILEIIKLKYYTINDIFVDTNMCVHSVSVFTYVRLKLSAGVSEVTSQLNRSLN
jgi:hypothetical protein